MDMTQLTEITSTAIKQGTIIIIGGVLIGQLLKIIPKINENPDIINGITILFGVLLGVLIPNIFSGADIVSRGILGGLCGMLAPVAFDKILKPILTALDK